MPNVVKEVFETLNKIDVSEYKEEKNGLSYLSWANAWKELKKVYPEATYNIKKDMNGLPYVYDENLGYMVFTDMTIAGITHEMWLPVMDGANKSMKKEPYQYTTKYATKTVEGASMFDINKALMRCLVKNIAMFGLGLYIYAGEDLPEIEDNGEGIKPSVTKKVVAKKQKEMATDQEVSLEDIKEPSINGDTLISMESRKEIIRALTEKELDIPTSMTKIADKLGINKALIKESQKEEILKLIEGGIK